MPPAVGIGARARARATSAPLSVARTDERRVMADGTEFLQQTERNFYDFSPNTGETQ